MESAQRDLEELVFRTLLERAVPVAIFCWRATEGWPVEFVSSNVSHVLGYGAEDFLSGRVVYARAIHPDDLPKVTREVEEHSASGDLVFEHEDYRLIDPEGRVIWVRDLTAIIRDDAGQITRYIGYIFECTARHEALDALALARRKAEAATLAKTEFFNNVSHEFRTPLTLMLGPLEDLLAGARGELPGPVGAELVMVHRNAQRLLKLVDALLDFSRLEAGRAEASFEPVDLAALTTDLASTFRSAVERGGVRLVVACPALPEPVFVDRGMWEQIVLNLLSNAFKFTLSGEIAVSLELDDGAVRLAVRDSGVGIPQAELPHLFERFHQVRGAAGRNFEGTGIGLALVQELTRLHGGTVSVESEPGRGSCFTVRVPRGSDHLPREHLSLSPHPSTAASTRAGSEPFVAEALQWLPGETAPEPAVEAAVGGLPRKRIVLADDNADMRDYVRRLLSREHEVVAVGDGRQALEEVRARRPDMLLSDVMMPEMDGIELLGAVRADPSLRTLPVLLLSARAGEEARLGGLEVGADDYVTKPFSAKELTARVRAQLHLADLRQQAREATEASERLYRQLIEGAQDGIVVVDREGVATLANSAAQRMFGYDERSLVGMSVTELLAPELRDQHRRDLAEYARSGGGALAGHFVELRGCRRSGEAFPMDVAASAVDLPAGLAIMYALRDTSERRRLQARVMQSERLASLGLMSAGMAHEINNPIAFIDSNLAVLDRDIRGMRSVLEEYRRGDATLAAVAPEVMEGVRRASEAADLPYIEANIERIVQRSRVGVKRVATIVTHLREFARLDHAEVATVDLRSMLESSVEMVQWRLDKQGIAVERRYGSVPPIACSVAAMNQVFLNLLVNAIQAIEASGRSEGRISISTRSAGTDAVVEIADNGGGIPEDLLPRIFDPFFTTKRVGEGMGLGLSISHSIVVEQQGRIEVESEAGRGALFRVILPRNRGETS
ncbi:MAG: PAS domain S-box protein [Deltaproteobacteria bacterium]|nr:PAS domain S-box protein [Deltaproteobacteria bacterium]MBK7067459.1 PAS domain S-box protein [Deltaproteobacteria bacterium]MBP6830850.1 PAS domain S-box protein [Deltaproteobacteria bacterium]